MGRQCSAVTACGVSVRPSSRPSGRKVIAQGSPRELIDGLGGDNIIEFALIWGDDPLPEPSIWQGLPEVTSSTLDEDVFRLSVRQPHVVVPALLKLLDQRGWSMASLTTRHASLEDVFVQLTGRHLASEEAVV